MIVVHTAACGSPYTHLPDFVRHPDVRYVAHVNPQGKYHNTGWDLEPLRMFSQDALFSNRFNAKLPKILPSLFFDWEYDIWLDHRVVISGDPHKMVEKHLSKGDIALLRHPVRDCVYDEIKTLRSMPEKETPMRLDTSQEWLEGIDFPEHAGLWCGTIFMRRNCPKIQALNALWWELICTKSSRDQITLPYALEKIGVDVQNIPGNPWSRHLPDFGLTT